ncbi:MAG TPA: hypothetical protein VGB18_04670 [Candidatus Thermoplasmatota archaeon]
MALFGRTTTKLTPRQRAQRKYAASMRGIRKRAKTATGGRGRIGNRSAATNLRRKLGIRTPTKKGRKVPGKTGRTTRGKGRTVRPKMTKRF